MEQIPTTANPAGYSKEWLENHLASLYAMERNGETIGSPEAQAILEQAIADTEQALQEINKKEVSK